MKKYFFICFAAFSSAAIATSANNSNTNFGNYVPVKMIQDTVPGKTDTTGKWKNKKTNHPKDSTDRMNRDSSLRR